MKRTSAAPAELAQHIRDLCEAFHLNVKRDITSYFLNNVHTSLDMTTGTRVTTLHLAPIVDDCSYIAALHEIGHVLHPQGHVRMEVETALRQYVPVDQDKTDLLLFEEEVAAWTWAVEQTIIWNEVIDKVARTALLTYVTQIVQQQCAPPRIFPSMPNGPRDKMTRYEEVSLDNGVGD